MLQHQVFLKQSTNSIVELYLHFHMSSWRDTTKLSTGCLHGMVLS